ncbi:MAG: sugar nucleotide-binding protein [Nanoarchaeota archaeon]
MEKRTILITGADGRLGTMLQTLDWGDSVLLTPDRNELDITEESSVMRYFEKQPINALVHCAALTDMSRCEVEPSLAIATNVEGAAHVVRALLRHCPRARFVYLSTDYVYPSLEGPYKENDFVKPFNLYATTKLGGECVVQTCPNHCIVRTSFFNPDCIPFDSAPSDAFCSKISFREGAEAVQFLLESDFVGVINVGRDRISLYDLLRAYRADIRSVSLEEVNRAAPIKRAPDSSLDVRLWKKLRGLQ